MISRGLIGDQYILSLILVVFQGVWTKRPSDLLCPAGLDGILNRNILSGVASSAMTFDV